MCMCVIYYVYIYIHICVCVCLLKTDGLRSQTWVFEGSCFAFASARLPQNCNLNGVHDGKPMVNHRILR